jgi:hypothetical protein
MANAQKTPLSRTLPAFTKQKAVDELAKRGQALPGTVLSVSGSIVTINFEVTDATLNNAIMPVAGAEYIRYPIQKGDKGVAIPTWIYLGAISGLGASAEVAATNTLYGNLSSFVWFPIGNKNWTVPPGSSANALTLYGKLTTVLLDSLAGNSSVSLASSGITLTFGSGSITMGSSNITLAFGAMSVVISSSGVTIAGKDFITHFHTLTQPGTGDSGPVAP